jgi:hypothetical protein
MKETTFKEVADQYFDELASANKIDIFKTDTSRLKRFYEFAKDCNLIFEDIDAEFLRRYTAYLQKKKASDAPDAITNFYSLSNVDHHQTRSRNNSFDKLSAWYICCIDCRSDFHSYSFINRLLISVESPKNGFNTVFRYKNAFMALR